MKILVNGFGSSGMLLTTRITEYLLKENGSFRNKIYEEYAENLFCNYASLYAVDREKEFIEFFINLEVEKTLSHGKFVKREIGILEEISVLESSISPDRILNGGLLRPLSIYIHRDCRDVVVSMLRGRSPSKNRLLFGVTDQELSRSDAIIAALARDWNNHVCSFIKNRDKFYELSFFDLKKKTEEVACNLQNRMNLEKRVPYKKIENYLEDQNKPGKKNSTMLSEGPKFKKYKNFFDEERVALIEYLAFDGLYNLGYMKDKKIEFQNNFCMYRFGKEEIPLKKLRYKKVSVYGTGRVYRNVKSVLEDNCIDIINEIDDADENHISFKEFVCGKYKNGDYLFIFSVKVFNLLQMVKKLSISVLMPIESSFHILLTATTWICSKNF